MQMVGAFAEFEHHAPGTHEGGIGFGSAGGRIGGRRPKLKLTQQKQIIRLVSKGRKIAADAARLFSVHPTTVSRLLQRS